MRNVWQDVRYGVRMLFKHRLTTLVCVVALALGIGVNTATFSVAEAFLLHPVPFDPMAFVGLPLILAAVSLLASYLPARRALRVDPIVALRHE